LISALFEKQVEQRNVFGGQAVPRSGLALLLVGPLGFVLGGCMQTTLAPSSDGSLSPRDRQLLEHAPYARADIPETYRRHIVDYPRREAAGTILVDTDARFPYDFQNSVLSESARDEHC
jgi:hypothetical protein